MNASVIFYWFIAGCIIATVYVIRKEEPIDASKPKDYFYLAFMSTVAPVWLAIEILKIINPVLHLQKAVERRQSQKRRYSRGRELMGPRGSETKHIRKENNGN